MTWTDEQLREAIVQSYEGERFAVPLSQVTRGSRRRRPMWIGAVAIATAAAAFVAVTTVGGTWRDAAAPIGPAATSSTTDAWPIKPTYRQVQTDCRSAGQSSLERTQGIPEGTGRLPDKYVTDNVLPPSLWDEPRGVAMLWLFADDEMLISCVVSHNEGLDVAVTPIAAGNAPWLHADELPFTGLPGYTYISGWVPADTEDIFFSGSDHVLLNVFKEELRGVITVEGAGWPYVAYFYTRTGEVTITVYTQDRIITRVGNQPATSTPR